MKTPLFHRLPALLLALALLGGCSSGSSGGGGGTVETGEVSIAVTDAPLSSLRSLTIDVSKMTLKGVGISDAQVFPDPNSGASTVSIDLLALQGLNQLVANAKIPVGTYAALLIEFSNPQAEDQQGVAQVVKTASGSIAGIFRPTLRVTTSSQQSVQLDVDLKRSVIDLGGNELFLAPAVLVQVLGQTQSLPLRRLRGIVEAIDTAKDRFALRVRFQGGASGGGGRVKVQCDGQTTFSDGQGNQSTGNVTSRLAVGDILAVGGSLVAGAVDADAVIRLGTKPPNAPTPPTVPPVVQLAGTLLSVDTGAGSITLVIQRAFAPGGTTAPAAFSPAVVSVTNSTNIHHAGQPAKLSDLVPGNAVFVLADKGNTGLTAREIGEGPAAILGAVSSVAVGGGASGRDRVSFAPKAVNQIPAGMLKFLPASLQADLPAGFLAPSAGDPFRIRAFFDGSSLLVSPGPSVGPPPPPPPGTPPPSAKLRGTVTTPPATQNNGGGIDFVLHLGGPSGPDLRVSVDAKAELLAADPSSGQVTRLTVAQAIAALNSAPAFVEVEGSAGNSTGGFVADIALRIVSKGVQPPPGPKNDHLVGRILGSAQILQGGGIRFVLVVPGPGPGLVLPVTVFVDSQARRGLFVKGSKPKPLTAAEAVAELNKNPPGIEVSGTFDRVNLIFKAHEALAIFR